MSGEGLGPLMCAIAGYHTYSQWSDPEVLNGIYQQRRHCVRCNIFQIRAVSHA